MGLLKDSCYPQVDYISRYLQPPFVRSTARIRRKGKVLFSEVCVCPQGEEGTQVCWGHPNSAGRGGVVLKFSGGYPKSAWEGVPESFGVVPQFCVGGYPNSPWEGSTLILPEGAVPILPGMGKRESGGHPNSDGGTPFLPGRGYPILLGTPILPEGYSNSAMVWGLRQFCQGVSHFCWRGGTPILPEGIL